MKILKFPFLSLSLFFVLGILSYPYFDKQLYLFLFSSSAILVGSRIFLFSTSRLFYGLFIFLSFLSLGAISISLHTTNLQPQHFSQKTIPGKKIFFKLVVQEKLKSNAFSNRYIADMMILDQNNTFGKVLLIVPVKLDSAHLKIGTMLNVYQVISPISPSLNPNQFDYRSYLNTQGIDAQVYLDQENFEIIGESLNFKSLISKWRDVLTSSFEIHSFSPDVAAIVHSLLFGQRQEISSELNTSFKQVGVAHILAISGLHIGILYLFLLQILKRLGLRVKLMYCIAILFLWLFAVFAGFGAPVVRAVVLFTLFGITQFVRRTSDNYNSLAICLLIMLCFNPYYIYDVGFQLSYLAVLSIIYFYPIFEKYTDSRWLIWRYFKEVIAVSLAVQIGILPLTLYYFHYFPSFFLLANILIIPLVTAILTGLFLLLGLNFIWEGFALVVGSAVSFMIERMNAVAYFLSKFSEFNVTSIYFNGFLALFATVVLYYGGYLVKVQGRRHIVPFLSCVLLFQLVYLGFVLQNLRQQEVLLLYDRHFTTFLFRKQGGVEWISSDSTILTRPSAINYDEKNFVLNNSYIPLSSLLIIGDKRVLIIDGLGLYQTKLKADIIVVVGQPKINFDRLIAYHEPQLVLIDGTFAYWETKRFKEICTKKNIPFHSVSEKGYFTF